MPTPERDARKATRADWETKPMTESRETLPLRLSFNEEEFQSLQQGLIPIQMEDKWFIFYEEEWLYFHRSWTGFCAFQVRVEKVDAKYITAEAWVARQNDSDSNLEFDLEVLGYLIYSVLLKKEWPSPRSSRNRNSSADATEMWSLFGRHILGQGP